MSEAIDLSKRDRVTRCQSVSAVLWPSFLTAGLATIIFFTVFDPHELEVIGDLSRLAVYSIGFFVFWGLMAVSSYATQYFLKPCHQVNKIRNE